MNTCSRERALAYSSTFCVFSNSVCRCGDTLELLRYSGWYSRVLLLASFQLVRLKLASPLLCSCYDWVRSICFESLVLSRFCEELRALAGLLRLFWLLSSASETESLTKLLSSWESVFWCCWSVMEMLTGLPCQSSLSSFWELVDISSNIFLN